MARFQVYPGSCRQYGQSWDILSGGQPLAPTPGVDPGEWLAPLPDLVGLADPFWDALILVTALRRIESSHGPLCHILRPRSLRHRGHGCDFRALLFLGLPAPFMAGSGCPAL